MVENLKFLWTWLFRHQKLHSLDSFSDSIWTKCKYINSSFMEWLKKLKVLWLSVDWVWNCDAQTVCVCVCRTQAFISVWLMTLMSTCSLCGTGRRNQKLLSLRYVDTSSIHFVLVSHILPLPSFTSSLLLFLSFRFLSPYLVSSFSFLLSDFHRVSDGFLLVLLCFAMSDPFVPFFPVSLHIPLLLLLISLFYM